MWYRVKIGDKRKFMDEAHYIDLQTGGQMYKLEARHKWLEGVVNDFDDTWSDGEILDEIVKLIDDGECNA